MKLKKIGKKVKLFSFVVALSSMSVPLNAFGQEFEDEELSSSDIVEYVNSIVDISDEKETIIENDNEIIVESDNSNKIIIDKEEAEIINIESEEGGEFSIEIPANDENDCVIEEDTVITGNDDFYVTTEFENGRMRNSFLIENEEAPEEFEIKFNLPEDVHLRYAENLDGETDGSIEAYKDDDDNDIPIAIDLPYAYDSSGNPVETFYKLDGDTVIQVVKHKNENVEYPIVADPSVQYSCWFSRGCWKASNGKWSLNLYPSTLLRYSAIPKVKNYNWMVSNAVINASWSAAYKQHYSSRHWIKRSGVTDSMKLQFVCHFYFAFFKSSFNLEPHRPKVSWDTVIKSKCNP